jgi:hypothetical protein
MRFSNGKPQRADEECSYALIVLRRWWPPARFRMVLTRGHHQSKTMRTLHTGSKRAGGLRFCDQRELAAYSRPRGAGTPAQRLECKGRQQAQANTRSIACRRHSRTRATATIGSDAAYSRPRGAGTPAQRLGTHGPRSAIVTRSRTAFGYTSPKNDRRRCSRIDADVVARPLTRPFFKHRL